MQSEVANGPAIALALQAALEGHTPWTDDLRTEPSIKRPDQHQAMTKAAVDDAIRGLEDVRAAEAARRAKSTPSPEQLKELAKRSREIALHVQHNLHELAKG